MHNRLITSSALLVCSLAMSSHLQAQATRTWVSGEGDDANPCSRTAPCKTFAGAISKTAAGGEINATDPAGYGVLTITKSMRVDGAGTHASILATGTNGVVINAGPDDVVVLRNLSINGANTVAGSDTRGIKFVAGKKLIIENCTITNFARRGISIESSTNNAEAVVLNTTVVSNGHNGIVVNPSVGIANRLVMDNVQVVENAFYGLVVAAGGYVQIRNSVISNNGNGMRVDGSGASAHAESVLYSGSNIGVEVVNGGLAYLSNVTVSGNTTGLSYPAGTVLSFGNNQIAGNAMGNGPASATMGRQ